jgi:DNA replication protein DnaC
MEQIGNPLERVMAQIKAQRTLPVSEKQVMNETDCPFSHPRASECLSCEDFIKTVDDKRVRYLTADCRAARRRQIMLAKSGLFGKDVDETFATARVDKYNRQLYKHLQKGWDRRRWLYIFSAENGTGKSYTANAIANMLISEGIQPLVIREVDMAAQLQASFDDDTGDTEYALMGRFKSVSVLVVQDFGKQGGRSDWWPKKVYDLLDHRLIQGKTTVLTSNYDLTNRDMITTRFGENHGAAIHSRLNGVCEIWELGGPDRRRKDIHVDEIRKEGAR